MSYKTMFSRKSGATDKPEFGGSDAILAGMFRNIIHDTGISLMKWNELMNTYIKDPRNSIPTNNKEQSSERGNLQKELFKSKMTWKVFCKGMRLLNFTKFKISLDVYHLDGKISIHSAMVRLAAEPMTDQEDIDANGDVKDQA